MTQGDGEPVGNSHHADQDVRDAHPGYTELGVGAGGHVASASSSSASLHLLSADGSAIVAFVADPWASILLRLLLGPKPLPHQDHRTSAKHLADNLDNSWVQILFQAFDLVGVGTKGETHDLVEERKV